MLNGAETFKEFTDMIEKGYNSLKKDEYYPCYGHDCYDAGHYHPGCPACAFFKTVKTEFGKKSHDMTDKDMFDFVVSKLKSKEPIELEPVEDSTEDNQEEVSNGDVCESEA